MEQELLEKVAKKIGSKKKRNKKYKGPKNIKAPDMKHYGEKVAKKPSTSLVHVPEVKNKSGKFSAVAKKNVKKALIAGAIGAGAVAAYKNKKDIEKSAGTSMVPYKKKELAVSDYKSRAKALARKHGKTALMAWGAAGVGSGIVNEVKKKKASAK